MRNFQLSVGYAITQYCFILLCVFSAIAVQQPLMAQDQSGGTLLEEIIVTATRREQTVQEIPYNITVVGGEMLDQSGITSLNSLAQIVPGLQNVDTGPSTRGSNNNFSIRGLRLDAPGSDLETFRKSSVASVSTYLGETPLFFPLMLKDIDRVEVLKGPQGTLYGSGSLAGTVRLMPNRPQFDSFQGKASFEGGISEHSDNPNGAFNAVVNAPLADNLALRAAGGYERLGGFVDAANVIQRENPTDPLSAPVLSVPSDPRSGYELAPIQEDTNDSDQWFIRLALRWQASETVDIEASFMHQDTEVDDAQVSNPIYDGGSYQYDSSGISPNSGINFRGGGEYRHTSERLSPGESKVDLGNLVINADLEFASFTSSSSYYEIEADEMTAYTISTQLFNPDGSVSLNYYDFFNNYPRANSTNRVISREETFTQEVRLVSNWDKPVDFLIGAYYQDQEYSAHSRSFEPGYTVYLEAVDGYGLPRPNGDLQYNQPDEGFKFEDVAIFGELTAQLTPQWQVTGGIRYFWQDLSISPLALSYFFNGAGDIDIDVENTSEVDDYILKFNTSFEVTPDLMLYAVYSEGFRRGGANSVAIDGFFASLPSFVTFEPDTSENYEIGAKGSLLDGRLNFNIALFQIDLDNFQFSAFSGSGFPIIINGDEARSRGVEFDTLLQATPQLLLSLSYAYMEAETRSEFLVDDLAPGALFEASPVVYPIAFIPDDTPLPTIPESSLNMGVDYSIPFGASEINLHGNLGYRSSAPGFLDEASDRYWKIPSQVLLNARVEYIPNANWSAYLFVNNITNDTAYSGGFGMQIAPNPWAGRYVGRPRTFGLGLGYRF